MAQPVHEYERIRGARRRLRAGRRAARRGTGERQSPADGDRADARGHGAVRRRIVVRLCPGDAACRRLGAERATRCRCSAPTSVRPRSSPISPAACRYRTRTVRCTTTSSPNRRSRSCCRRRSSRCPARRRCRRSSRPPPRRSLMPPPEASAEAAPAPGSPPRARAPQTAAAASAVPEAAPQPLRPSRPLLRAEGGGSRLDRADTRNGGKSG